MLWFMVRVTGFVSVGIGVVFHQSPFKRLQMDFLTTLPLKFVLPFILLGLQAAPKFLIDRRVEGPDFAAPRRE